MPFKQHSASGNIFLILAVSWENVTMMISDIYLTTVTVIYLTAGTVIYLNNGTVI